MMFEEFEDYRKAEIENGNNPVRIRPEYCKITMDRIMERKDLDIESKQLQLRQELQRWIGRRDLIAKEVVNYGMAHISKLGGYEL